MATTESRMKQLTGAYADLNKSNMLVGEMAVPTDHVPVVRNGVNSWEDISTVETMNNYIDLKTQDIVDDLTQGIDAAITNAENATNTAITTAENLESTYAPRLQNVEYATVKTDIALKNLAEASKSVIPDVKVSTYSRSSLLSSNSREGQMDVKVSGNAMKNEIVNGNFANGTAGWTADDSTITASNNTLTVTGTGTSSQVLAIQYGNTIKTGTKLFLKIRARVTNSSCTGIFIQLRGTDYQTVFIENPVQNTWYTVSGVITTTSDYVGVAVRHTYADSAIANGKVMGVKDVICIDMGSDSSNPLYNKTVAEMDAMTPYYFDGFSDVKAGVVRTVGKNLFNNTFEQGTILGTGENVDNLYRVRQVGYTAVNQNTTYTASYSSLLPLSTTGITVNYFDINKNGIGDNGSYVYNSNLTTFTTPVGCSYIRVKISGNSTLIKPTDIATTQIEIGSTATTFENYTSTVKYLPYASLKSLNNLVRDYIDGSRYVKNVSDVYSLQASDITAITTGTNLQYVTIPLTKFSGIKAQLASTIDGSTNVNGFLEKATIDGSGQIFTYVTDTTNMYLQFTLGKYANLAAAQTALAGTKIIYQLVTPIITEILPNTVKSSPNGSVQYLNVRGEVGYYGTNIAVTNSALPIKSLTSVKKISISDGSETSIDLATCTIASGGLTFTSTALSNGDLVDWNYEFDSALSTTPLIDYEYQNGYNGNVVIGTTTLQIKGGVIIGVIQS